MWRDEQWYNRGPYTAATRTEGLMSDEHGQDKTTTKSREDVAPPQPRERRSDEEEPVLEDLLVEDVSIDGMCGVY